MGRNRTNATSERRTLTTSTVSSVTSKSSRPRAGAETGGVRTIDQNTSTSVKSVHLSADSMRLAVGCDTGGGGRVVLFDPRAQHGGIDGRAMAGEFLREWEFAKPVWAVRLSSDGSILATAGFDCKVSLFDLRLGAQSATPCHQVSFEPRPGMSTGPAFIWTLNFSSDDDFLTVGCWNATASLYAVRRSDVGESDQRPSCTLELVACIERGDRVYACDLDGDARHMVVAGRDSRVALYYMGEVVDAFRSEAYGGGSAEPPKAPMWEVNALDFVYTVTLSADLEYCCFGGTGRKMFVVDGRSGAVIFIVPMTSTIWAVKLVSFDGDGGTYVAVGGESSTLSVWNLSAREVDLEMPCDGEIYSICLSQDSLCYTDGRCAQLYGTGGTGYAWHDRPSYHVITETISSLASDESTLLRCMQHILDRFPSVVNMTSTSGNPESGTSLLHWIVEHSSSSRLLELILGADCWLGLPCDYHAATRSVLDAAVELGKYAHMRLLLKSLTENRVLQLPTPMGVVSECFPAWAAKFPADFLNLVGAMPLQPEPEVLGGLALHDVMLPRTLVRGSYWCCPRMLWMGDLERYSNRSLSSRFERDDAAAADFSDRSPRLETPSSLGTELPTSGSGLTRMGSTLSSGTSNAEEDVEPMRIVEGFSRVSSSGVQAFRVPFEGFAGIIAEDEKGNLVSMLQLVVQAVTVTQDYQVFGTLPLQILLDFKWSAFGARVNRVCVVWLFGDLFVAVMHNVFHGLAPGYSTDVVPLPIYLLTWVWTTSLAVLRAINELMEFFAIVRSQGWTMALEAHRVASLLASTTQLGANILNALCFFMMPGGSGSLGLTLEQAHALHANATAHNATAAALDGSLILAPDDTYSGPGFAVVRDLHAFAIVAHTLRVGLSSFLIGFEKYGALIYMLIQVVFEIGPFVLILTIVVLGFSASFTLITHNQYIKDNPAAQVYVRNGFLSAFATTIDMGLYASAAETAIVHEPVPFVFYFLLMALVQVVLLNLLIALMSSAHDRIHTNARMVARYQRARLILELERRPRAAEKAAWRKREPYVSRYFGAPWGNQLADGMMLLLRRLVLGRHEQPPRPRWLHMLTPDKEHAMDDSQEQTTTEQMITSLQRQVTEQASGLEGLRASMDAVAVSQKQLVADLTAHMESTRQIAATQHHNQGPMLRRTNAAKFGQPAPPLLKAPTGKLLSALRAAAATDSFSKGRESRVSIA